MTRAQPAGRLDAAGPTAAIRPGVPGASRLHDAASAQPSAIWNEIRPADVATLANAAIGLAAIVAAWGGDTILAYHFIFLAIVVDGIDGAVARMGGGGGPLGHIIDTLADVVTFVVAPSAVLLISFGTTGWTIGAALLFLFAGLLRLARFQAMTGVRHFFGLSTPGAALLVGSVASLAPSWHFVAGASVVAAVAMLMRWPVPKLRGPIGVAALCVILANLAVYAAAPSWHEVSLVAQTAFLALYFAAGPAYLKAKAGVEGS